MYRHLHQTQEELDEKFPNRPHNHSKTLPFHDLPLKLFNPLRNHKKKPIGPAVRRTHGPLGAGNLSKDEFRDKVISDFIQKWRTQVGNDFYPAMRLIIPDKDRDRAMYGLKEKYIAKLLVRVLRIDKDSEDGSNLLNWKLPGQTFKSATAGDFAARCFEVISKRPIRTTPGNMTIAEVNDQLDTLSHLSKEEDQLPIFENFYRNMNAEELMWLIRIILRQMHIGATEKTVLNVWHPDGDNLFNVSSSLQRVCWELSDPDTRLDDESSNINLMECFQPQLAAFQLSSFEKIVARLLSTEEHKVFWIEDKLDGERMQLHMAEDASAPGGYRFKYWSRKAKDYSHLYGKSFEDINGALTKYLKSAFNESVRNIILDGEMIYWDMESGKAGAFGHLKTAVHEELKKASTENQGRRPVFKVFDCLYLNDMVITNYTLEVRREALAKSIKSIPFRMEILDYQEARTTEEIQERLREVVEESWEGLVLKKPLSRYRPNDRNEDWIKVKPEYMTEFGEALDCVVIGGYYGSGRRGGNLSSFLCGLRVNPEQIKQGVNPQKCYSFFKVGGGFTANDYADIRHRTDGKWMQWDPKKPPIDFIELGGPLLKKYDAEHVHSVKFSDAEARLLKTEQPDVWIKPEDSVVLEVKAASVNETPTFRVGYTLRFPRFKRLRTDKDWTQALNIRDFESLQRSAKEKRNEKQFQIDQGRRQKRVRTSKKKPLTVAGSEKVNTPYAGPDTKVFQGLTFFVISESLEPLKKSKAELEQLIKANGGNIVQKQNPDLGVVCIADRNLPKAASIKKYGRENVVRPSWLFDCVKQVETDVGRPNYLLPMEPRHMFFTTEDDGPQIKSNTDEFGDSYARDVTVDELREIFKDMPSKIEKPVDRARLLEDLQDVSGGFDDLREWMFQGLVVYFEGSTSASMNGVVNGATSNSIDLDLAAQKVRFASGKVAQNILDHDITHVVVNVEAVMLKDIRSEVAKKHPVPRIVTVDWVNRSWQERTLLDEERFAAS
ncbi:DNA ligase 4 [Rhizodiscina lignyota]|uniref:DNA ligase n=1 Tax=Rhizodiscina lignyota TaxID=1504668 RepID=A0A9P4INF7_9PEZI|nr:DNA ligase 4 [Rhizodiscina lignyota]